MSHVSNILLCGSPRVGKSTLINAICQEKLSKANASLNSVTKEIDQYSFKSSFGDLTHETIFWDTPGIESWSEDYINNYITTLIEKTQPICMIYCTSPGSFASLDHLVWIISKCHEKNVFCALVCTNMWAGRNRQNVINELCNVLSIVHPDIKPNKEDEIIYYDRVALVTMVNSLKYIDEDLGLMKPPSGVDELIFGIGKCLNRYYMFAWLRTVSRNQTFWTKMSSKLNDLLQIPYDKFNTICQHAETLLEYIFNFSNDDHQGDSYSSTRSTTTSNHRESLIKKDTEESIFHDAEMVEMPRNLHQRCLRFLLKSAETGAQLSQTLVELGATNVKVVQLEASDERSILITAGFENEEHMMAIYNLCQIIIHGKVECTLVD